MLRTHTCGELRNAHAGMEVILCGWVHRRRDHGGLIFIDLRDRYGFTQVVFDPKQADAFHEAERVRPEWVLKTTGTVRRRIEGAAREDNPTGDIEMLAATLIVLNEAKTPPFEIDQEKEVNEELRLQHRYLDLRHRQLQQNLTLRHHACRLIRDYFDRHGFLEIETPILVKGTPEGSREYLVPSRLHHGSFYVLPQSPQQLKQLCMVGGLDRYFQIARCFRDEDQRGDRQPEFTQFEIEMSFVEQEDVLNVMEQCFIEVTEALRPDRRIMRKPFPRLTWTEALVRYGSDKPDLRFDLPLREITDLARDCGFKTFAEEVAKGGIVSALRVPGGAAFSRKEIDDLTMLAMNHGAKGLAYMMVGKQKGQESREGEKREVEAAISSPIVKYLGEDLAHNIVERVEAETGDLVFFGAGEFEAALMPLGKVRSACAERLEIIDTTLWSYCWVVDFPLFERNSETGKLDARHHPFTRPHPEDINLLKRDPLAARAIAYDLVLNGVEVGGGSIRIHETSLQAQMFDLLGISKADAERRFGHLLRAFQYGAPPHGGIAMGLDRFIMLLCDEPNIREVIAFPKDQAARDLMLGAPAPVPEGQLKELGIQIRK